MSTPTPLRPLMAALLAAFCGAAAAQAPGQPLDDAALSEVHAAGWSSPLPGALPGLAAMPDLGRLENNAQQQQERQAAALISFGASVARQAALGATLVSTTLPTAVFVPPVVIPIIGLPFPLPSPPPRRN